MNKFDILMSENNNYLTINLSYKLPHQDYHVQIINSGSYRPLNPLFINNVHELFIKIHKPFCQIKFMNYSWPVFIMNRSLFLSYFMNNSWTMFKIYNVCQIKFMKYSWTLNIMNRPFNVHELFHEQFMNNVHELFMNVHKPICQIQLMNCSWTKMSMNLLFMNNKFHEAAI